MTLNPGTYCGLTINGSVNVTFNPGTYVFEGNVIVNGGDTISGTGITWYFSSGSLTMNGSSSADLVAPTTGTYAGILIYQNPSDTSGIILNGQSNSIWQGSVYAPGASLTINGGGNAAAYTIVDTASMTINGGVDFNYGSRLFLPSREGRPRRAAARQLWWSRDEHTADIVWSSFGGA